MADITLTVDYEFSTGLDEAVNKLVSSINASPPKIKVEFDVDNKQINELTKKIGSLGSSAKGAGKVGNSILPNASKVAQAASGMGQLTKQVATYHKESEEASKIVSTYSDAAHGMTTVIEESRKKNGEYEESTRRVTETFKTQAQASRELTQQRQEAANAGKKYAQALSSIETKQRSLRKVSGGAASSEYTKLEDLKKSLGSTYQDYTSGKTDYGNFNVGMTEWTKNLIEAKTAADEFIATHDKLNKATSQTSTAQVQAQSQLKATLKEINMTSSNITSSYKSLQNKLGGTTATGQNATDLQALSQAYNNLETARENLKANAKSGVVTDAEIENVRRLQTEMQGLIDTTKQRVEAENGSNIQAESAAISKQTSLLTTAEGALKKYTAAAKSAHSSNAYQGISENVAQLKMLRQQYDENIISLETYQTQLAKVERSLKTNISTIITNGDATQTLGQKVTGMATKIASWMSVAQVVTAAVNGIRQMASAVVEVDTAMTELKKVTNESDATYDTFLENASSRASELGATLSDVITASADFARLGYNIDDASTLADAAIVYKNVGDGIENISDASDSIISTMQAFGVDASDAMSIVDKFNEVGNNYAISSDGIGQALLRSASAMEAAGNTLDETIALTTAANTVVQNPEKVGRIMPNNAVMC